MDSESRHSARRVVIASTVLAGIALYMALVSAQFLSAQLSAGPTANNLLWAIRLDPLNAEYHDLLGRFDLLVRQAPSPALRSLARATALNPNRSSYWLDRAIAEQLV